MKRFYMATGNVLGVGSVKGKDDVMWTGANPFVTSPTLYWNLNAPERVSIQLTDITGKVVYSAERLLETGMHSLDLSSSANYATGTYILQVVRPSGVFTHQMVKQ
jgi:hypothetical protein